MARKRKNPPGYQAVDDIKGSVMMESIYGPKAARFEYDCMCAVEELANNVSFDDWSMVRLETSEGVTVLPVPKASKKERIPLCGTEISVPGLAIAGALRAIAKARKGGWYRSVMDRLDGQESVLRQFAGTLPEGETILMSV